MDARIQETHLSAPEHSDPVANDIEAHRPADDQTRSDGFASSKPANGHHDYGTTSAASAATSTPTEPSPPPRTPSTRVLAPDLLRGLLMILQAVDHAAVSMGAWQHGTARDSESDSHAVSSWNITTGWIARNLTHLCAPGFMFLLGMGVVYFGKSRRKLGWGAAAMVRHFAIRAVVLAAVQVVLGWVIARGKVWVLNMVLLALAANYFLAGCLWLVVDWSEKVLAGAIDALTAAGRRRSSSDAENSLRPLLRDVGSAKTKAASEQALRISWHTHNVFLLVLSGVTIFWNIWLSPTHGYCSTAEHIPLDQPQTSSALHTFFSFWFYQVSTPFIMSGFPPLAWLSFAILGLLYGRLVTGSPTRKSPPSPTAINWCNILASLSFALLFVATRLFHFGNLSENCLHMPEHIANPGLNQYLASFRAFFYTIKYPPDVAYAAYTISFNFLLLAFFGFLPATWARKIPALLTFGTSALFFYALHLPIYVFLRQVTVVWLGLGHKLGYPNMLDPSAGEAVGLGNTPVFWVTWAIGLAVLWPACLWYGRFKSGKPAESVWRFF